MEIRIKTGQYQDLFLSSESKFPALIAAVGTGKTLCLLTKIFKYCEDWPGSTGLIVRKEFTDLKDSTMKDFEAYFGVKVGSNKNYTFPNGSMIMFRHAGEIQVLKNINLSIAGIEQAEEFETDMQFQFIRDRMRQNNGAPVRPLVLIANANGHNWVWNLHINHEDAVVREIHQETAQYEYIHGEYHAITASTFANESNLVPDFIADLRRKEVEAPSHYRRYVLNSFEEMDNDDYVFDFNTLMECKKIEFAPRTGYGHRIIGYDIARYGNDTCAGVGLHQHGALAWSEFLVEEWAKKDLDYTCGRILSTSKNNNANDNIIDEDGIGSGPLDFITHGRKRDDFQGFRNLPYSFEKNADYGNARTKYAFKLKEYIEKGWLAIRNEKLIQELMTLRYRYDNHGRRILVSKEQLRKEGIRSPNLADALIMAASRIDAVKEDQDNQYYMQRRRNHSAQENLFQIAGVR